MGDVVARPMFGGVGLYHRGVFFGLVARDTLYLKVDERTRSGYEDAGMTPFEPYPGRRRSGRGGSMRYYSVPLEVLESPLDLAAWAREAVAAATAGATRRKP